MKPLRSAYFGPALCSALLWCACAAQEQAPFPHLLADSGGDSAAAGAETGGVVAAGGVVATGGATNSAGASAAAGAGVTSGAGGAPNGVAGAGIGGVSSTGGTSGAGAGGAAGGSTAQCPAGSKVKPGCACTATADDAKSCQALSAAIAHRYSFAGTGTTITDSAGTGPGTAINLSLTNTGSLDFTSGDQYADLPNKLISSLTNATLEAWVTWQAGDAWQRIYDFGEDATGAENNRSTGRSYMFLSPKGTGNFLRAVYKAPTGAELVIDAMPSLPVGDLAHLAVVFDDDNDVMTLYVNGTSAGSVAVTTHLSDINDINDWLGRSQFAADPPFVGSMQEFRIYSSALTAAELTFSDAQGPDATFFSP
jgi:hypothetical protein